MSRCLVCGYDLSWQQQSSGLPSACPNCGSPVSQPKRPVETGTTLIRNYFLTLFRVLIHPTQFFRNLPVQDGLTKPLTFALVTHWVGSALGFLTHLNFPSLVLQFLPQFTKVTDDLEIDQMERGAEFLDVKNRLFEWFSGIAPVLLDPFITLFSILLTSFLVFIGARILISPKKTSRLTEVTFESAVIIVSYGMAPSIFSAIPFVGSVVASFYTLITTVVGAREVFGTTTSRAIYIALFPKLLMGGVFLAGIVSIILLALKMFATSF
jgi:hypothetical protein